jgi:uncharacterized protein
MVHRTSRHARPRRRPGFAWFSALAAVCASVALAAPPAGVPNPRERDGTWVTDEPGALRPETLTRLNELLSALERDTRAEVAVAVVATLDGLSVEEYAVRLFEAWGIGKRGEDNGALLLWSPSDRRVRIEVGYGLEPVLTDGRAGAILDRYVMPEFRSGDFDRGVVQGVEAMAGLIRRQQVELPSPATTVYEAPGASGVPPPASGSPPPPPRGLAPWLPAVAGVGGIALVIASWFGWRRWRRHRPRRCPACGGRMRRLDEREDDEFLAEAGRLEERLGSVDYDVWQCPDCADRILLRYPRWFSRYARCRQCGYRTCGRNEVTLVAATTAAAGIAEVTERCEFCTYRHVYRRAIPRISTSSSSSSGGYSRGGGSFGGGRSGGGGASRGY